jgi:hypothetical protein
MLEVGARRAFFGMTEEINSGGGMPFVLGKEKTNDANGRKEA